MGKVSHSSDAKDQAITTVSALTVSLATIVVHLLATGLPLKLAISVFLAGMPPVLGVNSAPVWGAILR